MKLPTTPRLVHASLPRDYWHVRESTGKNFKAGTLRGYYIDMRDKTRFYRGPMREGFPLRNQNRESWQLLPSTVCQLALGLYENWLQDDNDKHLDQFFRCAEWLVKNHVPCAGKRAGWLYHFDHTRLGIKAPFISAMGQGQGISVLVRAHQLTQKPLYLDTARRALAAFHTDVTEGGVLARLADGDVFFEEYPCQPFSHILNGHLFASWGLYDYAVYEGDQYYQQLFDQGTNTLIKMLPQYDLGYWTRYGLFPHPRPNIASPFYHELHIAQMQAMYKLTDNSVFLDFANKWERQFDNWFYFARAVIGKLRFKAWVRATKKIGAGRIGNE